MTAQHNLLDINQRLQLVSPNELFISEKSCNFQICLHIVYLCSVLYFMFLKILPGINYKDDYAKTVDIIFKENSKPDKCMLFFSNGDMFTPAKVFSS